MSKRLQILMDEPEFAAIREAAARDGLTVSDWARRAMRAARREQPTGDVARKLAAVRTAARHDFPTGDIEQLLAETERGYLA